MTGRIPAGGRRSAKNERDGTRSDLRVIALDDPQGSNVMIVVSATDGDQFDAMVPEVTPVIDSFEFGVTP